MASHLGALAFLVAIWTLEPALPSLVSGIAGSVSHDCRQCSWLKCEEEFVARLVGSWPELAITITASGVIGGSKYINANQRMPGRKRPDAVDRSVWNSSLLMFNKVVLRLNRFKEERP